MVTHLAEIESKEFAIKAYKNYLEIKYYFCLNICFLLKKPEIKF